MSEPSSALSVFETSVVVPATPQALFSFHSDPRNLTEVMPPTMKLVKLTTDGVAEEDRLIHLYCRDWWIIPMRWTCRWKTVAPPHLLVDEIVKGPFRVFQHEHRFEQIDENSTRMQDRISYAWGHGWWGRLVSEIFVRGYLHVLFAYRHWRTVRWAKAQR